VTELSHSKSAFGAPLRRSEQVPKQNCRGAQTWHSFANHSRRWSATAGTAANASRSPATAPREACDRCHEENRQKIFLGSHLVRLHTN